jgi:hypothetical protein
MKHFYALLLLSFVISGASYAQELTQNIPVVHRVMSAEAIGSGSPQWEKEQDLVNGHIPNKQLVKMKNMTGELIAWFHDSCISEGSYSLAWHGEYFSERTNSGSGMRFGAQCHFYDQKANLIIMANDISPLLDHLVVNNQDILTIRPLASLKNDCPYFEYAINGEAKNLRTRSWLVTIGSNQLPYIPVTRKEYLLEARIELSTIRNSMVTDMKQKLPMRDAAVQEADKAAAIEHLGTMYSGADLQVRIKMFLEAYQTDEEYLKQITEKETASVDNTLHLMDSLINRLTVEQLNKPAIVSVQATDFRGFEDGHGDKMLIRLNTAFFHSSLSEDKPRCFLVSWQYDPSEPSSEAIDRQISERFDGRKLKEMLGGCHLSTGS